MKKFIITYCFLGTDCEYETTDLTKLLKKADELEECHEVPNHTISINTIEPETIQPPLPMITAEDTYPKFKSDIAPVRH